MSENTHTQPAVHQFNLNKLTIPIVVIILAITLFFAGKTYPQETVKASEPTKAELVEQAKQEKAEAEKKALLADKKAQAYQLLDEVDQAQAPKK